MDQVTVTAPVRVADVGGWTDTWFGTPGAVCHVAVSPGITVTGRRIPGPVVRLRAPDVGIDDTWTQPPGSDRLLESAIGETRGVKLTIRSNVPPGSSLGTSASVVVAVLAAVRALTGQHASPHVLAVRAHEVETQLAGRESGVQDQWAAAVGGVGLLTIDAYPRVAHRPVLPHVDLTGRLLTVVVGHHDSSAVHRAVVNRLAGRRPAEFDDLAALAAAAATALETGDLPAYGDVLTAATNAQESLDARLVGAAHHAVIDAAQAAGALGWKVNGAGGSGGSVTVLCDDPESRARLRVKLMDLDRSWQCLNLEPSTGVAVRGQ